MLLSIHFITFCPSDNNQDYIPDKTFEQAIAQFQREEATKLAKEQLAHERAKQMNRYEAEIRHTALKAGKDPDRTVKEWKDRNTRTIAHLHSLHHPASTALPGTYQAVLRRMSTNRR